VVAGAGLHALGVLPVKGDVDTWLGCLVPEDEAGALARRLGFVDVECLPDEIHAAGMGYWLVGRKPPAVSGATA
jgi:hypothetical protein